MQEKAHALTNAARQIADTRAEGLLFKYVESSKYDLFLEEHASRLL